MVENIKTFVYTNEDLETPHLELPVTIPYTGSVLELAAIFLTNNKIPEYLKEGTEQPFVFSLNVTLFFPQNLRRSWNGL